jgi:antirestriction protein ArdC
MTCKPRDQHYAPRDLYQEVTDRIVAALEQGTVPWVCPWRRDGDGGRPHNGASGHTYKGVNVILTGMSGFATSRWYTFRQAQDLGGCVRKSEKGTTVIYWQFIDTKSAREGMGTDDNCARANAKKVPFLKAYCVFNAEQIEWPEDSKHAVAAPARNDNADDCNYELVEGVIAASGAVITQVGTRAYYSPGEDRIVVPAKARFESAAAYYATAMHELAHWTGHSSRLGRDLKGRFGSDESYGAEELVAEMAAAFLAAELGIAGHLQHAEYIASWIKVLKGDKRAVFTASRLAQEAAEFILWPTGQVEVVDLQEAA